MTTRLVNLTPHALTLRTATGADMLLPASGTVARVSSTPGKVESVRISDAGGGETEFPLAGATVFGEVIDLPAPQEGMLYVVSGMVGAALRGSRADVVMPGTGPNDGAIRVDGKIVAVTRLVQA